MFFSVFKFDHQSDFCMWFSYHRSKLSSLLKTKQQQCEEIWVPHDLECMVKCKPRLFTVVIITLSWRDYRILFLGAPSQTDFALCVGATLLLYLEALGSHETNLSILYGLD